MSRMRGRCALCAFGGAFWVMGAQPLGAQSVEDLRGLSLEELGQVEVTSVAKRTTPLSAAPAAIYVISGDDALRSGAISLPETLRLAPNLTVARQDAQIYAISARGFSSYEAANKLLVLIDGRSVYTPLHGGVFWDQQQIPLGDLDRIEVISGPGGALWGANAFNGVVNIISKSAKDTQGFLIDVAAGNVDAQATARFGGELGAAGAFRIYAMTLKRGETAGASGAGRDDGWTGMQTGFRADLDPGANEITVQGDYFHHETLLDSSLSGGNILARWGRPLSPAVSAEIQGYYDVVTRNEFLSADHVETFDGEAKIVAGIGAHTLVAGGGYRAVTDRFELPPGSVFFTDPAEDRFSIANIYLHDEIAFSDRFSATAGLKYEYSSFTGGQWLPTLRVAWRPDDRNLVWAGVSRAVRTPTHIDRNLTAIGVLDPARGFEAEEVVAYEAGYRGQPFGASTLSVSLYYNDYDDLRILTMTPEGRLRFGNAMQGHGYGAEIWAEIPVRPWWRLNAGVNLMKKKLTLDEDAVPVALDQHQGNDPDYQFQLRSMMDVTEKLALDFGVRAVDDLESPAVPGYVEADARIAWRLSDRAELSISGRNLFDAHHPETAAPPARGETRRSILLGLRVRK